MGGGAPLIVIRAREDNINKESKSVRVATRDQQPEGIHLCSAHRTVTTARLWMTTPQNGGLRPLRMAASQPAANRQ
jgi:hypothetical protein